jgi:hypothetical protein
MPEENAAESLLARVESGRYPRVRATRRDVPRSIVRLVRQCLRPRAARRISSAAEARRRLETILDRPTTADCQTLLTSFLWDSHVFEPRSTETVVMVACAPRTAKRSMTRFAAATAALVVSILSLGFALRYPAEVAGWTDGVAREVGPIAANFGSAASP